MSFNNFKDNFSSGVSFLRRRFSSNDLQADEGVGDKLQTDSDAAETAGFNFNLPQGQRRAGRPSPSAPSSPSKSSSSGYIGGAGFARGFFSSSSSPQRASYNKDRCKTLLVIDESHIDWGKYFQGRKVFGDWDIRVEQAEFSEINLASYSDSGTVVDIQVSRGGTKVVRSFKPDFVLVRQHGHDTQHDWRNLIIGLHYGGVPGINPLPSIFSFLDKPYAFSQLLQLQQRLGKDNFPLVEQSFFPSHRQLLITPRFPVVIKIGHAHSGNGTVKVENQTSLQDITSVVAIAGCYCTMEPYIDSKYDLYIQKIGNNYRTFVRTSISGNWKVNTGSSMLEQVTTTGRFRQWIDECSLLFGGLDMVAIQAIVGKDGREHILEINDSSMPLLGETQEEDRRMIADLIVAKMEVFCKPIQTSTRLGASASVSAMNGQPGVAVSSRPMAGPPGPSPQRSPMTNSEVNPSAGSQTAKEQHGTVLKAEVHAADTASAASSSAAVSQQPPAGKTRDVEDSDDTMKNLRKTFAGIFGDM